MADKNYKLLVFGGRGAIGSSIAEAAIQRGWTVVTTGRSPLARAGITHIEMDPFDKDFDGAVLAGHAPYQAVCWAQGANLNDNVFNVEVDPHLNLYKANCVFVIATLKALLSRQLLASSARLCVISSIWQLIARQNKLSYSMSKAALQGLVLSASTDLASDGHLFNAVLPGPLDSPMTRSQLSPEQLARVESLTKFSRLSNVSDVTSLVLFLCSSANTGITGQFIAADLGMSRVHLL